ncbi:UDP-N-acetylenolpyruvoylglucosamine reductase [Candidatus Gottesmanbacteria bacterium RIFCSPLOWO2_01_FULL_43_11b]|uniref:UDP-N-acetylenolpyruvoylglucosamine reductase n=1 Tax=Candidatus Gottesmanbacteria bacterium RIFCSPLOWO2_01_FULL_43_11b TaxID=1798392 RepID=A0A1F6AIM7_9BACT|nr:MAG: UDP-N-acetylenolpyruvoylglucosamine reductase [Candidatus Gottesmanbacteria bacterium RIFCSPLOWO2_01_FULL_43_11b]
MGKKTMDEKLKKLKNILGEKAKENEPLGRYTTLKIGGPADLFFDAKTIDELTEAITSARKLGIPYFMLGGGTNILIGDRGIRGLVIKNSTDRIAIAGAKGKFEGGENKSTVYVEADSGVIMNKLVRFTIEEGLGGLEMQLGLPGTVGGAMYMNSKWTQPEGYVGDAVYQATILNGKNEVKVVPRSYFQFGYDKSILQEIPDVVLRVVFILKREPKEKLWEVANSVMAYRRGTQPQGVKSPGCTFRNISKSEAMSVPTPNHTTSAGFLIDHAGLKGTRVGDAQISPVHANFIVNLGSSSASDVVKLIEIIRAKVKQQFGVTLKEEIVRVGEF